MKPQFLTLCTPVLCIALLLGLSTPVYADNQGTTSTTTGLSSEQHIEQAQALFKEQKYSDAADHLMSAYQLVSSPTDFDRLRRTQAASRSGGVASGEEAGTG